MTKSSKNLPETKNTSHVAFIYLCRILAFTSVFVGHKFQGRVTEIGGANPNLEVPFNAVTSFLIGGGGVVLFLLVSGYVITLSAQNKSPARFLLSRILRIYPLYILSLISFWIYQSLNQIELPKWWDMVGSLTLMGDFIGSPNQLNGVEWTLRIEILFYAIAWGVIVVSRARSEKRSSRFLSMPKFLIFALLVLFNAPTFPEEGFNGYGTIFLPIFIAGVSFALFELKSISTYTHFLILILSYWTTIQNQSRIRPDLLIHGPYILIPFAIFTLLYLSRKHFANTPTLAVMASLTYSTYLFHNWLFDPIYNLVPGIDLNLFSLIKIDTVIALSIFFTLMYILFKYIESPFIAFGKMNRK